MTTLIKAEIQEIFYLFCAGLAVMLIFSVRDRILSRCVCYKRLYWAVYLMFWVFAAFLFYGFAYLGAYGCISWYSLAAFACGMILWKKKNCDIITLYHTAQKQDRNKKNGKKEKACE